MTLQIIALIAQLCMASKYSNVCQVNMSNCYMSRIKLYTVTLGEKTAQEQAISYCILAGKTK